MSLQNKLKNFAEQLAAALPSVPIGHYSYYPANGEAYVVWAEDDEGMPLDGDDIKQAQVVSGSLDYYTKEEFDATTDDIQDFFKNNKISFRLNSVQYEDQTEYIHYEWVFEI